MTANYERIYSEQATGQNRKRIKDLENTLPQLANAAEIFEPASITIASGTQDYLGFGYSEGDLLLDLTDSQHPVIVDDGLYALMMQIDADAGLTAGTYFTALFFFGTAWSSYGPQFNGFAGPSGVPVTLSIPVVLPMFAGDTLNLQVSNNDSVSRTFSVTGSLTLLGPIIVQ